MCKDRRALFSKTDLTGKAPKQVSSFNPPRLLIYKSMIVLAITMIAATWGAGAIIANIMSSAAQVNFDRRIEAEMKEDGAINLFIEAHIRDHKEPIKDRLIRIENMLDPIYEHIMEIDVPPRVVE